MKNLVLRFLLIALVLGLCAWGLLAKEVRLGKDLRGGVSLIYRVSVPEGADGEEVISQTITVLKDRVNPRGVFDIAIQPLGLDRIEVVMPLPNEEVQALKASYKRELDELMAAAQISPAELQSAVQFGQAPQRYCGERMEGDRCAQVQELQDAFDALRAAREELESAAEVDADPAAIAGLEQAVADAEIKYDELYQRVLDLSLDRPRVVRVLGLATEAEPVMVDGERVTDPVTGELQTKPAPREVALTALKAEFPGVAAQLDGVVAAYDHYQRERSGLDDPEDLKRLLRGAGVLEYHIAVDPTAPEGVSIDEAERQLSEMGPERADSTVAGWFPINDLKQWYDGPEELAMLEANPREFFQNRRMVVRVHDGQHYMLLYNTPAKSMTHQHGSWSIERTYRSLDQLGRPAIAFELDASGGSLMARLTGAHVNQMMAIVLDGEVYSAPVLQSQISKNGIISGRFSEQELNYLLRVLAAGSLEARLSPEPIAENTLGPSIGADNLNRGMEAFIISVIAVAAFMLLYYFFAGFVADLALLANGLIIFGAMASIDGTFTLPGLAGIVLTIGMAVDANVLIYERIREEIFAGEEDLRGAIRLGYAKALSTIIDGNVTNLIVCLVLFRTGTAEVKGFALTLTIGILATLFTALFMTRAIYYLYTDVFKIRSLPMLATVFPAIHRLLEPQIRWLALRHIFWGISAIAIVASAFMIAGRGEDLFDTEFRGGVTATMVTAPTGAAPASATTSPIDDVPRKWMSQTEVTERVRAIAATADEVPAAAPDAELRRAVLQQFRNAVVLTQGDTRTEEGTELATSFQVKVANAPDLGEEDSITDIVVDALVDAFPGDIDVSPSRTFEGAGADQPGALVFQVDDDNLGRVIGAPGVATEVGDFRGGAAIVLRDIDPPVSLDEVQTRLEQVRDQPDFRDTAGRRTRVVGLDPVDPNDLGGLYRSVVVLASEPTLSGTNVSDEQWYEQLAAPEWRVAAAALERQSSLQQVSSFSSAVAETLAANAVVAVIISLLGILVYVWVRFGSLRYSAAAIIALVHDVVIAVGLLAASAIVGGTALGNLLGIEDFRIDLGVVAALLTIIGYSLNDTIVILDRIRENRGKRPLASASIVNRSINQTISRTLLTSGTTLLAVFIMYVEGGSGIRSFTFTLLAGIGVGTYSSIAIAAPLVYRRSGPGTTERAAEVESVATA